MIAINEKKIGEIAEELEMGNRCFFNIQTEEIKSIPTADIAYMDEEFVAVFEEEFNAILNNISDYIEFEIPSSTDIFGMMEAFTELIEDKNARIKFQNILKQHKPFRNFKHHIESDWDYRESWFTFKRAQFKESVRDQIGLFNLNSEL